MGYSQRYQLSRKYSIIYLMMALFCIILSPARAEILIGLSVPLSGNLSLLGEQAKLGATAAVEAANAAGGINGQNIRLISADDQCSAAGGKAATENFLQQADEKSTTLAAQLGFLCFESAFAALDSLGSSDIPLISLSIRLPEYSRRGKQDNQIQRTYRLAPGGDAEAKTATKSILKLWSDRPFALVDDGTVYGRSLIDGIRTELELAGKSPQFTDTYRPAQTTQSRLIRRMARAGIKAAFIAGDGEDVAVIGRDIQRSEIEIELMAGEAALAPLLPDTDLKMPEGLLAIGFAKPELNPRTALIQDQFATSQLRAEGYALTTYAAVQTILGAITTNASEKPLAQSLSSGSFNTIFGPLSFDAKGDVELDLMTLYEFTNGAFQPLVSVENN